MPGSNGMTCDWVPEHDDQGRPKGRRCGKAASFRIFWLDGTKRFSLACTGHHLDIDPVAPPHRTEPLS